LSIVLVLGSQAKGSYVVMFALILLMFLYRLLHLYWKRLIPAATIALVLLGIGGIYVASNLPTVLAVLSKDASFSGRIPLWTTVLTLSEGKRLLGFGFGGFWATNTYAVYSLVGWNASKAHNGFIDLLLDLGWVGVIIYAMNTVTAIFRSMKFVAREKTLESQWPLLVLSLILLYNLVESDLLVPNSFLWAAYVVVTVSMQRIAGESRVALRNELPGDSATNEFPGSEFEPCPQ
jgi:O-antigen ligase